MGKKLVNDNRGMTMAEVLLAFVVLSIIMGLLSGIIAFSKKIYMEASDNRRAQEVITKNVYTRAFDTVSENGVTVTQFIPVYRVEPRKDGEENETGVYDIALIKQSIVDGKPVFTTSSGGFPEKAGYSGSKSFNNINAVTMGEFVGQVNLSDFVSDEDKEKLGDLKDINFLVFNKIK